MSFLLICKERYPVHRVRSLPVTTKGLSHDLLAWARSIERRHVRAFLCTHPVIRLGMKKTCSVNRFRVSAYVLKRGLRRMVFSSCFFPFDVRLCFVLFISSFYFYFFSLAVCVLLCLCLFLSILVLLYFFLTCLLFCLFSFFCFFFLCLSFSFLF